MHRIFRNCGAKVLLFALTAKHFADYFVYSCHKVFLRYESYASVLHDDESASVEVADGLLIDLLAHLEACLAFLSVIPVACWRCARTL